MQTSQEAGLVALVLDLVRLYYIRTLLAIFTQRHPCCHADARNIRMNNSRSGVASSISCQIGSRHAVIEFWSSKFATNSASLAMYDRAGARATRGLQVFTKYELPCIRVTEGSFHGHECRRMRAKCEMTRKQTRAAFPRVNKRFWTGEKQTSNCRNHPGDTADPISDNTPLTLTSREDEHKGASSQTH